MIKKKMIGFGLCLSLLFSSSLYVNASTVDQKQAYEKSNTGIVSTTTLYDVVDSKTYTSDTSNTTLKATGMDWDTVIVVCINGWDISRQDWWNPFDNNDPEWAKFKIGLQLASEDGVSLSLNTSGFIYKNGIYWAGLPSTNTYGDELIVTRTDYSPEHGDGYETTAYHKIWDDLGVNVYNNTTIEEFSF